MYRASAEALWHTFGQLLAARAKNFAQATLFVWVLSPFKESFRVGAGQRRSGTATLTRLSIIYTHGGKRSLLTAVISGCLMHIYCAITFLARRCPLPVFPKGKRLSSLECFFSCSGLLAKKSFQLQSEA